MKENIADAVCEPVTPAIGVGDCFVQVEFVYYKKRVFMIGPVYCPAVCNVMHSPYSKGCLLQCYPAVPDMVCIQYMAVELYGSFGQAVSIAGENISQFLVEVMTVFK